MSGFWDAVGRAALGRPGTATPRPRSIYEPEALGPTVNDLDALAEDADVVAMASPRVMAPIATRAQSDEPPSGAEPATEDAEPAVEAAGEMVSRAAPAVSELPSQPTRAVPRQPVTFDSEPQAKVRSNTITVERVDARYIESTELVTRSIASPWNQEAPVRARPASATELADPSKTDAEALPTHHVESPVAVVAEPQMVVPQLPPVPPLPVEPPLVIEIDRIDIRIEPERVASPAPLERRRELGTAPSLSEYLAEVAR